MSKNYFKDKLGSRVELIEDLDDELRKGMHGTVMRAGDGKGVMFDGRDSVSVGRQLESGWVKVLSKCKPIS